MIIVTCTNENDKTVEYIELQENIKIVAPKDVTIGIKKIYQ